MVNKILINNEWQTLNKYKNGDILTVIKKMKLGYYAITDKGVKVYVSKEECKEIE